MTDRRIAKTRLALRDAMLALMPERGWDELNVQDICDRANVGRSTFYLHYQGKEDLLAESLNDLRLALGASAPADSGAHQPMGFMSGLLAHMVENRRIFKSVVGRRSGHVVERRFRDMVVQLAEDDMAKRGAVGVRQAMLARSLSGALVDLMAWWVDSADGPSVDVLAQFMRELTDKLLQTDFTIN